MGVGTSLVQLCAPRKVEDKASVFVQWLYFGFILFPNVRQHVGRGLASLFGFSLLFALSTVPNYKETDKELFVC